MRRRAFLVSAGAAGTTVALAYRWRKAASHVVEPRPVPTASGASTHQSYAWELVTSDAGFAPRDGAGALVFRDRMWLLGGFNSFDKANFPRICNSEVWSSRDGKIWELVLPAAPWEGRHTGGYVVHRGKMWIVGGDANQGHYQSDIWCSEDGEHWERVIKEAPWGPRGLSYTAAFANKIWVMGGQTLPQFADGEGLHYNDVWCSEDGVRWEKVLDDAPWGPRGTICGSAVLHDQVFIIGGATYDVPGYPYRVYYSDVWASGDGVKWRRVDAVVPWEGRSYQSVAIFDGKLWIVAGHDGQRNLNDTWYSAEGREWQALPEPHWRPRHAASVFSFDDALWVTAGIFNITDAEVWRLTRTVGS